MSLLSNVKLVAQILGLVILIITLILTLRKFLTNNTATTTQILIGSNLARNNGITNSNQDNVQMIALNVINTV